MLCCYCCFWNWKKRHLWKIEELGGHIFTAVNLGKISNLCASLYITTNRDVCSSCERRPTNTTQRPCVLVVENASKKRRSGKIFRKFKMSSSLSTVIFSCTSNELTLQCPCNDCHMLISNTLYACIWPFWCPNDKSSKTLCHFGIFVLTERVGTKCQSVVVVNTRNMLLTLLANVYTDFECHRQSTSSHNISHTFPIMPACVTFSLGVPWSNVNLRLTFVQKSF